MTIYNNTEPNKASGFALDAPKPLQPISNSTLKTEDVQKRSFEDLQAPNDVENYNFKKRKAEHLCLEYKENAGEIYKINSIKNGRQINRSFQTKLVNKKPWIVDSHLSICDKSYPVDKITDGYRHAVYGFNSEAPSISLNEMEIPLSQVVLRAPKPDLAPQKYAAQLKEDREAYEYLRSAGVPLPHVFMKDTDFQDSVQTTNGGFWLIERMSKPASTAGWSNSTISFSSLSESDQKLLSFVLDWLTKMSIEEKDIINDFAPRNVMWRDSESLCIVDFTLPRKGWKNKLSDYVFHWSEGNVSVVEYLTSQMPEELKAEIQKKCLIRSNTTSMQLPFSPFDNKGT